MFETITWRHTTRDDPDLELVVLIHWPNAPEWVWIGYRDDDCRRLVDGSRIEETPTHWAELPEGPKA